MTPEQYKKRILIIASGLSPQVVTETLYALTKQNPPYIPTEIHLLTTGEGAERARLTLLHSESGQFKKITAELHLPDIYFSHKTIHTITKSGHILSDIVTPEDNELMANFITEFIREQCNDHESSLHVSIAGGRKTMGFYLGYALSLFGREQDRLSHVLVSSEFESNSDFFYPTNNSRLIYTREGKPLDTQKAQIMLASIPFLRINNNETGNLLHGQSFSQTISSIQKQLHGEKLILDPASCSLIIHHRVITLPDSLFAFYWWLILRKLEARPVMSPTEKGFNMEYAQEFLLLYKKIKGEMGDSDRTEKALEYGMSVYYLHSKTGDLKRKLNKAIGSFAAKAFLPYSIKKSGEYKIDIAVKNIILNQ